jgi:hypothetical protein
MKQFVAFAALAVLAAGPAVAAAQEFPGRGATNGTFPERAGRGAFPGGRNVESPTVAASEPLTLALVGAGLVGASLLRRRRQS